jgi:hypothetical protein
MIRAMESPSLLETLVRLPGALLRLPATALTALDAINDLAERVERLMVLLERIESGVSLAGSGIDLAASGISQAEIPRATKTLQDLSPELSSVVGTLDERFSHLDGVVTDLARLMEAVVGTIPGMRRVLRTTTTV